MTAIYDTFGPYVIIALGLVMLLVGGHYLVVSSVGIALRYRVSTLVIGLTLVAFATSAPELLVSLTAAVRGYSDMAMGNVFGSNIANVGLILGLTALMFKLPVDRKTYNKDWLFLMFITILLAIMGYSSGTIFWYEGLTLFAILVYYNYKKIKDSRNTNLKSIEGEIDRSASGKPMWLLLLLVLAGVIGLQVGASLLVSGSVDIALKFGFSERVVSLSIVALGTSLPELAASIVAARKGEKDLAVGNIIGSNVFNILAVLGLTASVKKIIPSQIIWTFDYWWVFGFTFMLYPLMSIFNKKELGRKEGFLLFSGYIIYMVIIFLRD